MTDDNRQIPIKRSDELLLGLAGLNLLAIFVYLGLRQNLQSPIAIYLFLYIAAFAIYLYAGHIIQGRLRGDCRSVLVIVFVFAVLFRLVLVHSAPSLSTDIYRYVWDGRLTCHWVNPYRWSPLDPRLASYRDDTIWQPMEYKAYQTVYMPISQLFFAIGYALFRENLAGYKLLFTLCDVGIIALIMAILRRLGKNPARAIWYAWCPLPVIEVSLAGHQDVTGIFVLILAIYLLTLGRQRTAALSLAAAGLTKGFALLLLPLFARMCGKRLVIVMTLSLIYLGLPLWTYLPDFLHGMQQYLGYVHVNSGMFSLVDWLLRLVTRYHFRVASNLSDAAILAAIGWSVWTKPRSYEELVRRGIAVIAICLLVVPTLFPWYVLWLLPLATLYGARPSTAVLCLAFTVDLVYVYYIDRAVHWYVAAIEYIPVYLLLGWEIAAGYWRPAALDGGGGSDVADCDMDNAGAGSSLDSLPRPAGVDAT